VFQDPALIPDLTVKQNLVLTGANLAAVRAELERFGLDGLDLDEQVRDIPLPFLRMLDLARAMSHQPKLLVLDEITAALPPDLAATVFEVVDRQKAGGGSVLFITHRLDEVLEHCDVCTVFRDGRAVDAFAPRDGGQERIVAAMLGDAVVAGLAAAGEQHGATGRHEAPLLEAQSLALGRQLTDVSLRVYPGEVLGVVALEGQGQDGLFDVLSGNRRPDSGTVRIGGTAVTMRHPAAAIGRGVVLVPADRLSALLPQQTIRDNIAAPLYRRLTRWGPLSARTEGARVRAAIERLSIDTRATYARELSGGNQQKLTIAKWLAAGFSTLLLFDPTRGIDIGTKRQIYALVRELAGEGKGVIMYTSELAEVELVCDRVLVIYQGRAVAELGPDVGEKTLLNAMHGILSESSGGER
jgi:ribose transport system ATP-binding protein